jgi:hypothetical protein
MIKIAGWEQYEVDAKGRVWEPGAPIRQKPLEYVRVAAHGSHWTPSYRDLLAAGGNEAAAALGVFTKLIELSARQTAELRGLVHVENAADLARVTGFPEDVIASSLGILQRANWIEVSEDFSKSPENSKSPESPENSKSPESPGNSGGFLNRRVKEHKQTSGDNSPGNPGNDVPPSLVGFDAFWAAYPRHTAKAIALRIWTRLEPDAELQASILRAVEVQKTSPQWRKNNGEFIPHAATWLNQKRWQDEVPCAAVPEVEGADAWDNARIAEFEEEIAEGQAS